MKTTAERMPDEPVLPYGPDRLDLLDLPEGTPLGCPECGSEDLQTIEQCEGLAGMRAVQLPSGEVYIAHTGYTQYTDWMETVGVRCRQCRWFDENADWPTRLDR